MGGGIVPLAGVFQRWFLYPPDKTPHFHPNETTLAWLHRTYPALPLAERPLECTLRPGEVSLTPGLWKEAGSSPRSPWDPPLLSPGRSCTFLTVGGTPRSTWTPASSSPPSWGRAGKAEDVPPLSWLCHRPGCGETVPPLSWLCRHPGCGETVLGWQVRLLPPPWKDRASSHPLKYWCRDQVPEEVLVFTGLFPSPWIKVVFSAIAHCVLLLPHRYQSAGRTGSSEAQPTGAGKPPPHGWHWFPSQDSARPVQRSPP